MSRGVAWAGRGAGRDQKRHGVKGRGVTSPPSIRRASACPKRKRSQQPAGGGVSREGGRRGWGGCEGEEPGRAAPRPAPPGRCPTLPPGASASSPAPLTPRPAPRLAVGGGGRPLHGAQDGTQQIQLRHLATGRCVTPRAGHDPGVVRHRVGDVGGPGPWGKGRDVLERSGDWAWPGCKGARPAL